MERKLPFGWTLCQYWPAEIILKHPSRKRGIYIKAPWCPHIDKKRWEGADGRFYLVRDLDPLGAKFGWISIKDWDFARRYSRSFTYTGRYGFVQTPVLTARRTRVRRVHWWLRWLPFAGHDGDELDIEFSEEMGNERGSWKGGCIGTSCTMLPGETVEDCIHRFLDEAQASHRWDR